MSTNKGKIISHAYLMFLPGKQIQLIFKSQVYIRQSKNAETGKKQRQRFTVMA